MNKEKRKEIFTRFTNENPDPKTELNYSSNFELLIAVILSAQATDKSVNNVTKTLFKVANTPKKMLSLSSNLKDYIKTIGLYQNKAKNILKTCEILINEYNSIVPNKRDDLERLPGVGRKTANVVLNTAFSIPVMAVDTHIFRVSNRTKIAQGKDVREVENKLVKLIPKEFLLKAHHHLILHGRYTCIARKPRCGSCLIEDLCEFKDKEL